MDSKQTLLPFVFHGTREYAAPAKSRSEKKSSKFILGSRLDSMYHVPVSALSREELARHKRTLTMMPTDMSFSNQMPLQFEAFHVASGMFSVPRFYGIEHWGVPSEDCTTEGSVMNLAFSGTLNDVQRQACGAAIERLQSFYKGGILVLPCGYGKTVCALYIASQMKRRTLVLVHKGFLVEQWQARAQTFLPGCTVGRIQQNVVNADADIVIGMVQSFSRREYGSDVMSKFGTVIIDESHHMAAPVLHKALRQVTAKHIVSLSATPERRDGLTNLLYWSMGSICYKVERQPEHTLVSCILYEGGKRKEILYRDGKVSMPLMLNNIVDDDVRNASIASKIHDCFKNERYIIVLTDRIKQLNTLYVMLQKRNVQHDDIGFYIGTTKAEERELSSRKRIILSTYSMAKEGLDIPRLDTLVLATPKGDIVQASGRIQRKHADKKTPLILDFVDTFSVFEQLRWKRWAFYRRESFTCQTFDSQQNDAPWYR